MNDVIRKYVLVTTSDGPHWRAREYIALDRSSGGYPYGTTLDQAKQWDSLDEAVGYNNMFSRDGFQIKVLKMTTELMDI